MYSLAIYLYMLGIILVSPFHRKARAMFKGRLKTYLTLRRKLCVVPCRIPWRV